MGARHHGFLVSVLVLLLLPSIMLGAKRKGPKAWDQNLVRVARSYVEPAEVGKRSGGHAKWDENMIRVARSGGFPLNLAYLFESLSNRGAFEDMNGLDNDVLKNIHIKRVPSRFLMNRPMG